MSEDTVWCNLVRNENKNAENQPDWVAPPNLKAPEGKKWTIGVKIGDVWHNQAGWNELDEQGNITGITIKMTPPTANEDKPATANPYGKKGFQSKSSYGNKQSYKF
tara:strand:- start:191 stop:508 length:318 start_codon:yes stop_codon:yes gene_type:complete